ncbi:MAG: RagB/SusD family nutrient uptake outer membrane protein [Paludibacteraceae bacterium]|nr:RagB/SusD family nutrient uptake outer membrane protein [Paludibacteraceae bacterium]
MKNVIKYASILLVAAMSFTACDDWMNAEPQGATKTADQKKDAAAANPTAAAADISAIYAQFIQLYAGLGDLGYTRHNDFGYAAICMFMEEQGQDYVSANIGYNWFNFSDFTKNRDNTLTTTYGLISHLVWNEYYKIIHACNNVIEIVDREDPGAMRHALSQALAVRAFCYLQLAQLYQFTYSDATKSLPCVPIVKDRMPAEQQEANPRATVEEVFTMIKADLDYACDSLDGFVRSDKGYVDQAVAFGLRARANLIMQNWAAAAADADKALQLSGATPLSIAEAGVPGFASASAHNVLWANIVVETNDIVQTGIINWPSHMSSFYGDGYTSVGATRWISSNLFSEIAATDVRKGWWLDENLSSPLLDAPGYNAIKADIIAQETPYQNVKFGTGDGSTSGLGAAAADWILMRAEELILIKAEGLAKSGGDGAGTLAAFVQANRDPSYNIGAHGLSIEDEIWWQRRVELWGEGFAWGDIMRLEKDIIRSNSSNWPAEWANQDITGSVNRGVLLWRIPQAEIEANRGISEADNNPFVAL